MSELVNQRPVQIDSGITDSRRNSLLQQIIRPKNSSNLILRIGLLTIFLICGLVVFVFSSSYFSTFPTNTSGLFKVGIAIFFLTAALISSRIDLLHQYWRVLYGFFVASMVNVFSWYFALYLRDGIFEVLNLSLSNTPGMTFAKVFEAIITIGTIVILIKLAGENLASLYLSRGNLQWSITIGILALVNLTASAILLAGDRNQDMAGVVQKIPWLLLFAIANGFMEELWFRGLFLKRLQPHIGPWGAVWLTSIWFGLLHVFAVYVSGVGAVIFGVLTLSLGIVFALVMQKTRNIWGAGTFHAAADINMFISYGML